MTQEELTQFVRDIIKKNIPYKLNPPYSLEMGMNCYAWLEYIYSLMGLDLVSVQSYKDLKNLVNMRRDFIIIEENPQFLDIPLFYRSILDTRHVGIMLNKYEMTQCSSSTNGVSICEIDRQPWKNYLQYFYRRK